MVTNFGAAEVPGMHLRAMIVCDVHRAHFYAKTNRDTFIELSDKDPHHGCNLVGDLRLCFHCTRDAAKTWQESFSLHLETVSFICSNVTGVAAMANGCFAKDTNP